MVICLFKLRCKRYNLSEQFKEAIVANERQITGMQSATTIRTDSKEITNMIASFLTMTKYTVKIR
ncbi:hypothetical protein [Flavobacterium sp. W20_MBD1_R3]|uniref:hypothetical protein n=1 Tax=Flavobacterium sp. W20_MBD1_R3 TaxID=3240278 RepID=UPI003F8F15D9